MTGVSALPVPSAVLLLSAVCAVAAPAGHYVHVNDIRMYYELHGAGSPLLLLHGGMGNGMQFDRQVPAFEKTHELIVPDCRTQGRSTDRQVPAFEKTHELIVPDCRAQGRTTDGPLPMSYHQMAEDVLALLDSLHLSRVDVMGWSDGGNIGLDLAIHHPDRIGHLVTFGANFAPDGLNPQDVAWGATATPESLGADMREGWKKLNPQPDHYEAAMTRILDMWRTQPHFTPAQLHSIRAKTLICAGEHDVVRREHTEALAHAIPGAQLWIVPGASHGAMLERPDLVNPKVLEFLSH